VLKLENVCTHYGAIQALDNVSVEVNKGEIVTLIGANGAGKTTLLMTVCGTPRASSGTVTFLDNDITHLHTHAIMQRGIAISPEGRRVFPDLTVEENLVAATYALTGRPGAKVDFDLVYGYFPRLFERRRGLAGYLSGGEQQMLAIGRALIAQPRLMLLDEPSLGLSPMLVESIFSIIARINREQGVSMLLVEQNASVALAVAHYGYIMETGKVVIDGSADRLAADPDVREFYLGVGGTGEARGFRDIKHYKRRKRWLS
jgi:branched-chain amino acid transport system ATP-binding protein